MKDETEETVKGILQRITSPWFFTFIPWWVVFNYDFLLRIFGKFETAQKINEYYCAKDLYSTVERFTIFGCINRFDDWHPAIWKLLFPVLTTVVSMTILTKMISYFNEKFSYYSLSLYERQTRLEKEMQYIDNYTVRLSNLTKEFDNTMQAIYKEKRLYEESGKTFPDDVLLNRINTLDYKKRDVVNILNDFMFVRRYLFGMQNTSVRKFLNKFKKPFKQKTKPPKDEPSN